MNFALAITIAVSFWGARGVQVPCQPVAVPGADAQLPMAYGSPIPMAAQGCRILISSQGTWLRKAGPAWYCGDMVHEVGHIAGLPHSEKGLMAPVLDFENIPYECVHWKRFARRHGLHVSGASRRGSGSARARGSAA
jgi:hypothetical protein